MIWPPPPPIKNPGNAYGWRKAAKVIFNLQKLVALELLENRQYKPKRQTGGSRQ